MSSKILKIIFLSFFLGFTMPAYSQVDTDTFDPYDTKYPPLSVYASNTICANNTWHGHPEGSDGSLGDPPTQGLRPEYPKGYVDVRDDDDVKEICANTQGDEGWYFDRCMEHFKKVRDKITNPCEYLVAFKQYVRGGTGKKITNEKAKDRIRECYNEFNVYKPEVCRHGQCDKGGSKNDAIIMFFIVEESDCYPQTITNTSGSAPTAECVRCTIDKCNPDVDAADTPECQPPDDPDDPPPVIPLSQGCIPDTRRQPWRDISVGGIIKIDIPDIAITFPRCATNIPYVPPKFDEFERD